MMFNANKLKVQLKLAVNRLKMLQNKKGSINAQQRKEIAMLLEKGKEESARIRVEHIIREDYTIEAMEMVEIYCEMLLARFGLIEQMKTIDPAIQEAACSIIYAAPRCEAEELTTIKGHLGSKYGKEFVMRAAENKDGFVNERLINKLKVRIPDPKLVTRYLIEIAKNYNVAWVADEGDFEDTSLMGDSTLEAEFALPSPPKATSSSTSKPPGGNGGGTPAAGFSTPPAQGKAPAQGVSSSTISSVSDSMLDDMFPSVPTAAKGGAPPPSHYSPQPPAPSDEKEAPEDVDDDGSMPDFDELTKRFEALKRRQ